ncbi:unnamed protein product [Acanthocheilonema viteae]|uniref:SCP domain-containing protein n=1 Tax=Acanthocheilonema viteae TaxID=6277 RepID=A0A498SKK7_ACAVI|nr:unnamed protein product [Acanthocheilonema viteae]
MWYLTTIKKLLTSDKLSDLERLSFVDLHNQYRSEVIRRSLTIDLSIVQEWNYRLEEFAQERAEFCKYTPMVESERVGENIFYCMPTAGVSGKKFTCILPCEAHKLL